MAVQHMQEEKNLPILFVLYLKIDSILFPHHLRFSRKLKFPGQKKIHGKLQQVWKQEDTVKSVCSRNSQASFAVEQPYLSRSLTANKIIFKTLPRDILY